MDLSNDAKILYALLFDWAGISRENGYIEPDGRIRLYFILEEAKENSTGAVRRQPVLFRNWKETPSTTQFPIMRRMEQKAYWTSCAVSWPEIWRKQNESC